MCKGNLLLASYADEVTLHYSVKYHDYLQSYHGSPGYLHKV